MKTTGTYFKKELESLLNRCSMENASGTPDFILAEYLFASLRAFEAATVDRSAWHGHEAPTLNGSQVAPPVEREPVGNAWRWSPGTISQWAVAAPIPKGWRWLGAVPLEAVGRERRVGEEQMAWAVFDPVEVIHE